MTCEERYKNDSQFRALVSMMRGMIEQYQFTPSELREAAIFAATLYELNRFPSHFIAPESMRDALQREAARKQPTAPKAGADGEGDAG